jgi:hypothetical protein
MALNKAAELAKPTPKVDPQKLNKADLSLLKLMESFTPAAAGDWSPVPTTVGEALNQLAARLKDAEDAIDALP